MSYRLSPTPRLYFTYNGVPAAGGKIYTYLAGTTIEEFVYANDTGVPHTNPVILDANGSTQICLDTAKAYKYIIKSSNNDLIDTIDHITSSTGGIVSDGKVLVSDADTASGYLSDKITTDGSLVKTIVTPGGNETLSLKVAKLPTIAGDSSSQYLADKITTGAGITKTIVTDPTYGKQVQLAVDADTIDHSLLNGRDSAAAHPIDSIDVTGGSLGDFTHKAVAIHASTWYMGVNEVQISSFAVGSTNVMRLTTETGTVVITDRGAVAVGFTAQETIPAGYVLGASTTLEGYCVLNPAYGHASIGVSYNDAATGETVWAVVKGKVKIKLKDSTSVSLGAPLIPCDAVGRVMSAATSYAGDLAAYSPSWAYNMSKVAVAIGAIDGSGFVDTFVL